MPVPARPAAWISRPFCRRPWRPAKRWYAKLVRTRPRIVALFDQAIRHSVGPRVVHCRVSEMENLFAANSDRVLANGVPRGRGRAPGALSHMVAANLRARALAPVVREIWAAGFMSYNAVSRELKSTECATPSGRKAVVPDDCGKAAGPSRTGGPHPDQASTFSRLSSEPRFVVRNSAASTVSVELIFAWMVPTHSRFADPRQ